jgi:copper chaperone CopZ
MKNFSKKITVLSLIAGAFMSTAAMADNVKVNVNGMVCGFCAQGITKKLTKTDAVEKINVDLESKIVSFSVQKGKTLDDEAIKKLLTEAGYTVVSIQREKP